MRVLRCGDHAVLVELDDLSQVLGLYAALRAAPPIGTARLIPAARTLLVGYDPNATTVTQLTTDLRDRTVRRIPPQEERVVEVPVHYDGEDLDDIARLAGLSRREVITRHVAGEHTVGFCGFAPGFAYITGLDPALHVPRHTSPRTAVPPGAVALADRFTGIYPRTSPGGWRIIGHTDLPVWDLERDPPTVLTPGSRIHFIEVST